MWPPFAFHGMSNQTAVLDETMEETESPPAARAILSTPFETRSADLPEWFRGQQQAAWAKFETLPAPARKDQAWRFSNVNALDLSSYNLGAPLTQSERQQILERSVRLSDVAGRLIFADDQLVRRD